MLAGPLRDERLGDASKLLDVAKHHLASERLRSERVA